MKSLKAFSISSIEKIFILHFLTMFIFYSFQRMIFLYWNWNQFVGQDFIDILRGFAVGLRFDLSALSFLFLPAFILYIFLPIKKLTAYLFTIYLITVNGFFLVVNFGDIEFVNFTSRRMSFEGLFIVKEAGGKLGPMVLDYKFLFFLVGVSVLGYIIYSFKKSIKIFESDNERIVFSFTRVIFITFILCFLTVASRGGLQEKPISFVNAQLFVTPILNNFILNSTFTVVKSYGKKPLNKKNYFENEEELKAAFFYGQKMEIQQLPAKIKEKLNLKTNLVLIIVEGLSEEYMQNPIEGKEFTPFLNKLKNQGLYFENYFANGKRSMEGVAALLASVPALMDEPFISSNYATNQFMGLGSLFAQQGYATTFFHGGHNGTMYFDTFTLSAGYQKYFGFNEYPDKNHDDGTWGIFDGPFLDWMIQKLNEEKQPFHSTIFTLSSHQPYKVPTAFEGKLPEGSIEILKTIAYVDQSLAQYFQHASKQDWYQNTLFIITADHTQKHVLPEYNNLIGDYKIPLLFFHPQLIGQWQGINNLQLGQQIDLIPTVIDLFGMTYQSQFPLAKSLVRTESVPIFNLIGSQYMMISADMKYILLGDPNGQVNIFSYKDLDLKRPLQNLGQSQELIDQFKAGIQIFSNGMYDNRLYYPVSK